MTVMLNHFTLPDMDKENNFFQTLRRRYNNTYPFGIFPEKEFSDIEFAPITIFYGNNGSGKSTLLNIIAEKLSAKRRSPFNGSPLFYDYIKYCRYQLNGSIPKNIQILTSDDVSEYILDMRYLSTGLDIKREELFDEYLEKKYSNYRLKSLADYDEFKEHQEAKRKSQSAFVESRLMHNPDLASNGETAVRYFCDTITENGIYLLDEPENSLSATFQLDLAKYIEDSAKYFNCQFIIATHSPFFLSIPGAKIYNLDVAPPAVEYWTDLPNMRAYFDLFMKYRWDFQ